MTEEEKKEFEEFLRWKKERERQKIETPSNASNIDSQEEKYDRYINNEKNNTIWWPIVLLCLLIYLGIVIASKIDFPPPQKSSITSKETGHCSVDSVIKDTMQERIVREIKEEAKQKRKGKANIHKVYSCLPRQAQ